MVDLSQIAAMLQTQLNTNEYGIIFDIKPDRNTYIDAMRDVTDFHIPGVLSALPGNYEPLQGIKVYYMPVALELWAYAALGNEGVPVPFTLEQQKACVSNVVEALNGTTVNIGNDAVIVAGAVVTVGDAVPNGGGGYVRIPLLVTLQLTVVQSALMSNDVVISIDGERVYFTEFSFGKEKQGGSQTIVGTLTAKNLNTQQLRTFSGTCFFIQNDTVLQKLENDILNEVSPNNIHVLGIKNHSFNVTLQNCYELLRAGAIVQMQLSFVENLEV